MSVKVLKSKKAAKVNLTFEIKGLLKNGYHEVETLLHTVDLLDEVTLRISESQVREISIKNFQSSVYGEVPMDNSNIAVKAIDKYLDVLEPKNEYKIEVEINKNIPIAAGLAGGSADAAAALSAINGAFDNRLKEGELLKLASGIGADVPFSLRGGLCYGRGKGDILEELAPSFKLNMVLIKPRYLSISTPKMFQQYDQYQEKKTEKNTQIDKPNTSITKRAAEAIESHRLEDFFKALSNDFETVFFNLYPELIELKTFLLDLGCWTVNLTGSGPTMYATVPSLEKGNLIVRSILAHKLNNPEYSFYKHGPLDMKVVQSFYPE